MKLPSKPISSPSRTEKFPPPLMRFLRTNGGNKSRGRSRSSPMLFKKKNTPLETQEPTSPKVTCIGQVRVRRSKQKAARKIRRKTTTTTGKGRFHWILKTLICKNSLRKPKPTNSLPIWRRWFLFFRVIHCKKEEIIENSARRESKQEKIEENDEQDEEPEVFISIPPKNALLLMRCRSEPHRASSQANRFFDSPLRVEDLVKEKTEQENRPQIENEEDEKETPISGKEPINRDSAAESRTGSEIDESLNSERSSKISKIEDEFSKLGDSGRPLILTRCKSEPARSSRKLDTEAFFWNKKRLGFDENHPHVFD